MSFMFKPYRFTDPEALNRPEIPSEISNRVIMGNEAVARELVRKTPAQIGSPRNHIPLRCGKARCNAP